MDFLYSVSPNARSCDYSCFLTPFGRVIRTPLCVRKSISLQLRILQAVLRLASEHQVKRGLNSVRFRLIFLFYYVFWVTHPIHEGANTLSYAEFSNIRPISTGITAEGYPSMRTHRVLDTVRARRLPTRPTATNTNKRTDPTSRLLCYGAPSNGFKAKRGKFISGPGYAYLGDSLGEKCLKGRTTCSRGGMSVIRARCSIRS